MNTIHFIVVAIVAVAALNWGLVGFNPAYDLITLTTSSIGHPEFDHIIKMCIGLVGCYYIYLIYTWQTNSKNKSTFGPH